MDPRLQEVIDHHEIRKMLAEYKKRKSIPPEYGSVVVNMINASAGLNGIFLLRPFNLMPPFMPPPITGKTEAKTARK